MYEATKGAFTESYKPILKLAKYPSEPEILPVAQGTRFTWNLEYRNDGRGIARSWWWEFHLSVTEPDEADRVMLPSAKSLRNTQLPIKPGKSIKGQKFFHVETDEDFARRFERWKAGYGWLNAELILHYLDETGHPHGSSVCYCYRGSDHAETACVAKDANGVW